MSVYQWVLLGVTCAVVVAAFCIVLALELRKHKKLQHLTQVILRTKAKLPLRIFLIILGGLLLIGGPVIIICCSYLVEPIPPKEDGTYAVIMGLIAFGGLFCLYGIMLTVFNTVYATEEGLWVQRLFLKTKFYRYDEVVSVIDTTYRLYGGYAVFKKGKKGNKQIFFVSNRREKNARELIALLKKRAPALKRWSVDDDSKL